MSNEYWDKQPAERTPEDAPPLMGQNDNPSPRIEVSASSPTIDGVSCSPEEKRFHNDALTVMAGEAALDKRRSDMEEAARRAAQHQREIIEELLRGAWLSMSSAFTALSKLEPGDLTDEAGWNIQHLYGTCGRTMEQAARVSGRVYEYPAFGCLRHRSNLKQQLQQSVKLARTENSDA